MASYLKFDGVNDEIRFTLTAPGALTSVVLTCFARFLTIPRWTAPVIRFVNHTGLWLRGNETVKADQMAMQGSLDCGDTHTFVRTATGLIPATGSTVPFRLGQIYKIQVVLAYDAAVSRHSLGFFVDGVKIKETFLLDAPGTCPLLAMGSDIDFVIGGIGSSPNDTYSTDTALRYPQMDIIQAKWELNRTVTFNGSGADRIPVLDADSDPFTDMTIDGSASDGGLYLMNEGSGTTVADSSGNGHDITLAGTSVDPDWAPAADPSFPSGGTARWTFGSVQGYALRHSDAPDVVHQPIFVSPLVDKTANELRLRLKPWDWFEDGTSLAGWTVSTSLSSSTTQSRESGHSVLANAAAATTDRDALPIVGTPSPDLRWVRCWFYDAGGTDASRLQRMTLFNSANTIEITIGVHIAISATHYSTTIQGAGNTASSVAMSVGWHEFAIFFSAVSPSGPWAVRLYIDGVLVRTDTTTDVDGFATQIGIRQAATGTNGEGYYDFWQCNLGQDTEHTGIVPSTGTLVFPRLQPAEGVRRFLGFTVTEVTAGVNSMEKGTTLYEFRHSTNGGSSFGSWTTLSVANLNALVTVGTGQDVLELRVTQTSSMDNIGSPATREVDITYQSTAPFYFREYIHGRKRRRN